MIDLEISMDAQADAMYVYVQPLGTSVKHTVCLDTDVLVDLDGEGRVVGIEFLAVSGRDLERSVTTVIDKYVSPIYGAPSDLDAVTALRLRHLAQIRWKLK